MMDSTVGATVRRADNSDAKAIAGLVNRAYQVEQFFVDGERTDVDGIRKLQRRGYFLVLASAGGPSAGLAAAVYVRTDGGRGYFGLLSVDPTIQREGIGRRLIAVAEAMCQAEGCTAMDLQVVNLRAELPRWYRSLGYRECGTLPFTERSKVPCHFIRMSKAL